MKKVIVLAMAFLLAGFVTGCGGGGGGGGSAATAKPNSSSASSSASTTNVSTVKLTSTDKALNITYKSVANGEFPPAPPVSNAPDASSAIN